MQPLYPLLETVTWKDEYFMVHVMFIVHFSVFSWDGAGDRVGLTLKSTNIRYQKNYAKKLLIPATKTIISHSNQQIIVHFFSNLSQKKS